MIKIAPNSKDSVIGEEHLDTIRFGLQYVLKVYKDELEKLNRIDCNDLAGEEIHLQNWYENKIYDTEKLLKEINLGIENIKD